MRATDHERIAEAVASTKTLYFSDAVLASLKRGSTYPDHIHKRRVHHKGRQTDIKNHIYYARLSFLRGDLSTSAFNLGIAFHYVADATCPGSEQSREHQEWEREVAKAPLPKRITPWILDTPNQILDVVDYWLRKKGTPYSSLSTSITVCAGLLELTWRPLSDKTPKDEQLIEETRKLMPSTLPVLLSYLSLVAALGIGAWLGLFIIGAPVLIILIALVVGMIPLHYVDKKRSRVLWILKWYGLK